MEKNEGTPGTTPIKLTGRENVQTEADLNANINASVTHSEPSYSNSCNDMEMDISSKETAAADDEGNLVEAVDGTSRSSEIVATEGVVSEESVESGVVVTEENNVHEVYGNPDEDQLQPQISEDIHVETHNISGENDAGGSSAIIENQIVVQEEELVENIEDHDGTPTVVVATEGEGGQYEIHMVGSEFRELTEGLPEGTQLMTEDGQLIHAVQEDEHGNVVVLANHPLTEIHTVDEQTGETVVTETSDVVTSEVEESSQHLHDVVSEAAAEAQVSYVQEEILEQQTDMVMLGEDAGYIVTEGESEELIVGEAPTVEVIIFITFGPSYF